MLGNTGPWNETGLAVSPASPMTVTEPDRAGHGLSESVSLQIKQEPCEHQLGRSELESMLSCPGRCSVPLECYLGRDRQQDLVRETEDALAGRPFSAARVGTQAVTHQRVRKSVEWVTSGIFFFFF